MKQSMLKSMPRTVRWRIHLGIIALPPSQTETNVTLEDSTTAASKSSENDGCQNIYSKDVSTPPELHCDQNSAKSTKAYSLKDILVFNEENIKCQRSRFNKLSQKHLWENSPLALIEKEEEEARQRELKEAIQPTKCKDGTDPLSAILMEEDSNAEHSKISVSAHDNKNVDDANTVPKKAGNSSWSEFYSSRETLNIIEKDLHRLSPNHCVVTPISTIFSNHASSTADDAEKNTTTKNNNTDIFVQKRVQLLSQILFVYARQNPELGYRQGMHEILSFVLIALEVDFYNLYNPNAKSNNNSLKNEEDEVQLKQLLDKDNVAHDAFSIFETIMYHLSTAYDSNTASITTPPHLADGLTDSNTVSSGIESISQSVMVVVKSFGSDALYHHLTEGISIPPQLYCARWIRLMFTRELTSIDKALYLWDKLFYTLFKKRGLRTGNNKEISLISLLEYTCAAMIVRIQDRFTINEGEIAGADFDPNESIDALMNYPPMDDAKAFWKEVQILLERQVDGSSSGRLFNDHMKISVEENPSITNAMSMFQNFTRPIVAAGEAMISTSVDNLNNFQYDHFNNHGQYTNDYVRSNEDKNSVNDSFVNNTYNEEHEQYLYQQRPQTMKLALSRLGNRWNQAMDNIGDKIGDKIESLSLRNNNFSPVTALTPPGSASALKPQEYNNGLQNSSHLFVNQPGVVGLQSDHRNLDTRVDFSARITPEDRLAKSIHTLNSYLQGLQRVGNGAGGIFVPKSVWDALAEVDAVRKEIIAKRINNSEC